MVLIALLAESADPASKGFVSLKGWLYTVSMSYYHSICLQTS